MATFGSLEPFDVSEPSTSDSYHERLECFLEANDVSDSTKKRAIFLSVCGAKMYATIRSLVSSATPSSKTYDELIQLVKTHFSPKPSEIIQRFLFYRRNQQSGESINAFIAELRKLSEHCNFGSSLDVMLRDRLVCGLLDEALQRRLLAEASLTFNQALDKALAAETANFHVKEIRSSGSVSVAIFEIVFDSAPWRKNLAKSLGESGV